MAGRVLLAGSTVHCVGVPVGHSDANSKRSAQAGSATRGRFDTRLDSDRAKAERAKEAMPLEAAVEQTLISIKRVGPARSSLVELVAMNPGLGLRITDDSGQERLSAIAENDPLEAIRSHPELHWIDPQRQTEFEVDPACDLTETAIAQRLVVGHDTHPVDPDEFDDLPPRATGAVVVLNGQTWVELDADPSFFVRFEWLPYGIVYDQLWAELTYDVPSSGSSAIRSTIGIAGGVLLRYMHDPDNETTIDFLPDGERRLAVLSEWLLGLGRLLPSADAEHVHLSVSVNIDDGIY